MFVLIFLEIYSDYLIWQIHEHMTVLKHSVLIIHVCNYATLAFERLVFHLSYTAAFN